MAPNRQDTSERTASALDVADSLSADEVLSIIGPSIADDVARRSREALVTWEPPVPLDGGPVPRFPLEALPPALRDYVRALADFAEVPPDLPGLLALAVAAAAVARKTTLDVREGYSEPLNLFTVVSMPPGTRKSSVFAEVTAPLVQYERELTECTGPQIAEAQAQRRVLERELADMEGRAARATGDARLELDAEVRGLASEVRKLTVPAEPRVLMGEATPEAIAHGLAEQGGRLAVFSPEGDVFGLLRRYTKDGAANFEVFLKAHAGDELRVDRRHAPPVTVPHPALTVALAVQPDVLHGLARDRIFRERGLLARFLYAVPSSELGSRTFDGPPVLPKVRAQFADTVLWLCRWPSPEAALTLTPEAYRAWRMNALAVERALAPGGRFVSLPDWAGKLPGLVARLAGVLHVVQGASLGRVSSRIAVETMAAAAELGSYAAGHALAAFGMMGADAALEDAKTVLEWLRRERVRTFSTRDTYRTNAAFTPETARAALAVLHERGWIRPASEDAKRPGRPREGWETFPGLVEGA